MGSLLVSLFHAAYDLCVGSNLVPRAQEKESWGRSCLGYHVFQAQAVCALAVYQQVTDDTALCFSRTTSAEISWIFYVYWW